MPEEGNDPVAPPGDAPVPRPPREGRPHAASERALEAARASGLIAAGQPLLVLVSGGADSVCLLDVAVRIGAGVEAMHVNYGLRGAESEADEALCRDACARLGVPLAVDRVALEAAAGAPGNLQAEAREARYALAERRAGELGADYATGHTASDQAETVLYRLVTSPGRRALLGMPARRGRLVRPLLGATRAETRAYCEARGLAWREDASNADPRYARARVRHAVLPELAALSPAAERTLAETSLLLRDEEEVLRTAVAGALERLGGPAVALSELRSLEPALARLVLRRLAEDAVGRAHPLSRGDADALLALGRRGGTARLDLGGGLRAVAEYGTLRFTREPDVEVPEPVELPVPGAARFGPWDVAARLFEPGESPGGLHEDALVPASTLGASVVVRAWRAGDRMRPAGLGGSKSLQDIFTDRKVPRGLRGTLPVFESEGEIVWVAGVAVGERFRVEPDRVGPGPEPLVSLSARRAGP